MNHGFRKSVLFLEVLKILAKEFEVPVLALSQLSRQAEMRAAKQSRPQLSDLRESGSIEQDADMVAFLYREAYYNKDTERENESEFIIAKHRNGPTDTVLLSFTPHYARFDNLEFGYTEM